jgi:hypothetical protein
MCSGRSSAGAKLTSGRQDDLFGIDLAVAYEECEAVLTDEALVGLVDDRAVHNGTERSMLGQFPDQIGQLVSVRIMKDIGRECIGVKIIHCCPLVRNFILDHRSLIAFQYMKVEMCSGSSTISIVCRYAYLISVDIFL